MDSAKGEKSFSLNLQKTEEAKQIQPTDETSPIDSKHSPDSSVLPASSQIPLSSPVPEESPDAEKPEILKMPPQSLMTAMEDLTFDDHAECDSPESPYEPHDDVIQLKQKLKALAKDQKATNLRNESLIESMRKSIQELKEENQRLHHQLYSKS